ncbi:hypothetical protein C1882_20660 [Pseudomonas sp. FW305-E2]|uniref:hypothetical protein n=1 Tax=Pseudomonas sp. FW305-E2 TaxID=2075558 RepID=UPI000B4FC323|nr:MULTISPECIES: hypothetical protein [Pseudomonas]POA82860.1 hypothetical protein C1882_20660 [Pseudomonas sp. FW305-E2]
MPRPTLAQYLQYLGEKPQTKNWGAILVYDRFKTNMLLTQEHIERFDGSHWLRPINLRHLSETGSYIDLSELTFSKPSLTFVNSSIGSSDARLSLRMIGGTIKHLREKSTGDTLEVLSISRVDPLTAPYVHMNISLKESNGGNINDKGRVTLNLAEGTAYTFEVFAWKDLNDDVGRAIRREFESRDVEEQVWELNTLAPVEGELKPTFFSVRTHSLAKAGQTVASTDPDELEEGAVLVGVAFNGGAVGDWPANDKGFPYLLPQPPTGEAYTANIILHNAAWAKDLVAKMIKKIPEFSGIEPTYEESANGFIVRANYGELKANIPEFVFNDPGATLDYGRLSPFSLASEGNEGSFSFEEGKIKFRWQCHAPVEVRCCFTWSSVHTCGEREPVFIFTFEKEYLLSIESEGPNKGRVTIVPGEKSLRTDIELDDDTDVRGMFWGFTTDRCAPHVKPPMEKAFEKFTSAIEEVGASIDVLRLNGLLFRSEQAVQPVSVHAPGDLSLLGTLAPKFTAFAIEPLEVSIGAGASQDFVLTTPPNAPVTWTVKPVPGSEGEIGSIKDGTYTAPTRDKFTGASKQVIVEAQSGDSISRALVTVVARKVSAFPLLQVANYSPEPPAKPRTYLLIGGSLDEQLQWSMGGGAKGALREPNADDDNLEIPPGANARIYVSPTHQPGAANTIGRVLQLDTVRVSAGGETDVFDILIAWFPVTGVLKATQPEEGKLALELWTPGGMMDPELIPPETVDWYTVRGAGNIDEKTGVYTINEKDSDYVILAAIEKARPNAWDYVVLPLPFDPDYIEQLKQVKQNTGVKEA